MSSKAIKETRDDGPLAPGWQAPAESAPSLMRPDEPRLARFVAFFCFLVLIVALGALWANARGSRSLVSAWIGPGWASVLLVLSLAGLLYHASLEKDLQYRRTYGTMGFAWLAAGVIFSLWPVDGVMGALFLPYGFVCFLAGLLFLLPFVRNEAEEQWRSATILTLGGVGAALALVGLVGGNVDNDFLVTRGLPLVLLGLCFLWAFVGLQGADSERGHAAVLGLGLIGALCFLVALGRSVLPPLLYSWGWLADKPDAYLVPQGLLLMFLGLLYLGIALGILSDAPFVVMLRRELSAYFFSPVAYIVILGLTVVGWYQYLQFLDMLIRFSNPLAGPQPAGFDPLIEPVLRHFLLDWFTLLAMVFMVPVLTMRLLSEEKRTGTLEVLFTAPVQERTVVLSKFFAALFFFLLACLPWGLFLVALRVEAGREFDYRPMLSFYLALTCSGAAFIAMGLFFSSLARNQIAAAILTFVGMAALTGVFFLKRKADPNGTWASVLTYFSYLDVWIDSLQGLVIPRYLIFQCSFTVFWLFLTIKVLEARKWA